jgi:hypothetical protein
MNVTISETNKGAARFAGEDSKARVSVVPPTGPAGNELAIIKQKEESNESVFFEED